MLLASARRSDSPAFVEGAVSEALEQTRREIVNLRGLIAELRPAALDELGLDAAVETLTERSAAAAGLEVETQIELNGDRAARLAPETETTVYRVVERRSATPPVTRAGRWCGSRWRSGRTSST